MGKEWTSSSVTKSDITVTLSNDGRFVLVKGKTYKIREDIKQCGLGWNAKEKAWQIITPCFDEALKNRICAICVKYAFTVSVFDPKTKAMDRAQRPHYDFRVLYDGHRQQICVTRHPKMDEFWRKEGFLDMGELWTQT